MKKRTTKTIIRENKDVQIAQYVGKKLDGESIVIRGEYPIAIANFKKDKLNGKSIQFVENGLIREIATFKNDIRHGVTVSYDKYKNFGVIAKFTKGLCEPMNTFELDKINDIEHINKVITNFYNDAA